MINDSFKMMDSDIKDDVLKSFDLMLCFKTYSFPFALQLSQINPLLPFIIKASWQTMQLAYSLLVPGTYIVLCFKDKIAEIV